MLVSHFKSEWYKYILQVLVVVIGIIVAYTLNNIKDARNQDKEEIQYYRDILMELKKDLDEIQGNRKYNKYYMDRYIAARNIIISDPQMEKADSLAGIAVELLSFSDFKKNTSVYQLLVSSGKLDLIGNKNILYILQNLEHLYSYINRLEKNQQDILFLILPDLLESIYLNSLKVRDKKKLYGYKFHNYIELYLKVVAEKDMLYLQAENELKGLIKLLTKELK